MKIDFIYFDVGGVVIKDFSKTNKWNELLGDLGLKPEDRPRFDEIFDVEEKKFCLGEKSADSFVDVFKNEFGLKLPDNYSYLNDFLDRFEPNPALGEIIKELKKTYRIGLLTNMYPDMLDGIKARGLLPDVKWDVIVDSSIVHLVKPQPEIFHLAEKMAGTAPERILFVENGQKHVDGAKAVGWNALLYDPSDVEVSNSLLISTLKND